MEETVIKVREEDRKPDIKTLIFSGDVSIWWKDEEKNEERLICRILL